MMLMSIHNPNAASGSGQFTTSAPEATPVSAQPSEPEFFAMPGPGQTLEGLRRGALYCLWRDGEIETVSVRRKGKSRGRRLIVAVHTQKFFAPIAERTMHVREQGARRVSVRFKKIDALIHRAADCCCAVQSEDASENHAIRQLRGIALRLLRLTRRGQVNASHARQR